MSEPEPEPERSERPGVLHGTSAPLCDGLRSELFAAIEAIYAACGSNTSTHPNAPKPEARRQSDETNHDAARGSSEAACERLTEVLNYWHDSIQERGLRHQQAIYHLHPPGNRQDFESWVMAQSMSEMDSALVVQLRRVCPKSGFEVLPVVMEYTGTTCQYNAWISCQQQGVSMAEPQPGEQGYWKTYQHVRHTPRIYQFKSFSGLNFAEDIGCKGGNVLDEKHVAWERARRGIFSQDPHEQYLVDSERRVREADPKWYQKIIPGTTADLGTYFAPAVILVPSETQLELVGLAKIPQPVGNIWRYLLRQCEESVYPEAYFKGLKEICYHALPKEDSAPTRVHIAGMTLRYRDRQNWVDAIDPQLMGDLIMTVLAVRDKELFEHLAARAPVHPTINYSWLCQNLDSYDYSLAAALKALRRFLFQDGKFLQIACIINRMPAYPDDGEDGEIAEGLANEALAIPLSGPVLASHGRAIADMSKYFKDFRTWSELVSKVISQPRELWKNMQFTFGLLNRLLEAAKRDNLPLDQVKSFYRKYENLIITADSFGQLRSLISSASKDQSSEANTARQAWREPEPTNTHIQGDDSPQPTSSAVIAGLFRSLDRLEMHEEMSNLVEHIVKHQNEIKPINMASLWLPCLRFLQDLVDATPTFEKLFQTIFALYYKMVFEDDSLQLEDAPASISPMAPCCKDCKYLNAYLEQPGWKKFHIQKPREVIDHIQDQLREQKKPIETTVYGKNEASITMQLKKASLLNKELGTIKQSRKQEATKAVRQFEPGRLLPFLGDKGDIMWKLGNAEGAESSTLKTPARLADTPSSSVSGLSRTSSSSSANAPTDSAATTPCQNERDPVVKSEIGSSLDSATSRASAKTRPDNGPLRVKVEGTPSSSSKRTKDIRDEMFASVKKERTPSSGTSRLSTRDRLKNLQPPRRESTPKFNDYSNVPTGLKSSKNHQHTEAPASKTPVSATIAGSSSSSSSCSSLRTEPSSTRRDPLASSLGGIRSREPVRTGVRRSAFSRGNSAAPHVVMTGLSNGANATPGPSAASNYTSSASRCTASSSRTSGGLDFMSAVLDAERARKGRSSKSTWQVKTASGKLVGSGMSSGKSRFDGLAKDKENIGLHDLGKNASRPLHSSHAGALAARSYNAGTGSSASASLGSKRKAADDEIIDLCSSSSPESAASKRQKIAVFDPLDDDPFGD